MLHFHPQESRQSPSPDSTPFGHLTGPPHFETWIRLRLNTKSYSKWGKPKHEEYTVASPAMGHWGTCSPRLPTISF